MKAINWRLYYEKHPRSPWRWHFVGRSELTGEIWAHYLFVTKPNARTQRRTKRGKMAAVMFIEDFLTGA